MSWSFVCSELNICSLKIHIAASYLLSIKTTFHSLCLSLHSELCIYRHRICLSVLKISLSAFYVPWCGLDLNTRPSKTHSCDSICSRGSWKNGLELAHVPPQNFMQEVLCLLSSKAASQPSMFCLKIATEDAMAFFLSFWSLERRRVLLMWSHKCWNRCHMWLLEISYHICLSVFCQNRRVALYAFPQIHDRRSDSVLSSLLKPKKEMSLVDVDLLKLYTAESYRSLFLKIPTAKASALFLSFSSPKKPGTLLMLLF